MLSEKDTQRFWSHVDRRGPDECWPWRAFTDRDGHGQMKLKRHMVYVHRIAYELAHGSITGNGLVCHGCNTPQCCNPKHLYLGTHTDNNRDTRQAGHINMPKVLPGRDNPNAKLTDEDVRQIRLRYATGGVYQYQLAEQYGVCQATIWYILKRKTWRHV